MTSQLRPIALAAALGLFATTASAGACDPGKPGADLTADDAQAVYDCFSDEMKAGYDSGAKRWIPADFVSDYRDWTLASAHPAAPGFHGGRFLTTWVNEAGADEYLEYASPRGPMPAGTRIAKESFSVNDEGKVAAGPLFLMEKVEEGTSPETDDWYYMMVSPGGAPVAVNVVTACSACHQGSFGASDGMGYPVPSARISN